MAAYLLINWPPRLVELDRKCYDALTLSLPRAEPTGIVEIVDIDENSLAQVGRWPWPREKTALLVRKLFAAKAAVVVLDVMFPEPDYGRQFFAPVQTKSNDQILAESFAAGNVVLGYAFIFEEGNAQRSACQALPTSLTTNDFTVLKTVATATQVVCSLPQIEKSAAKTGFLNASADSDGLTRRIPLLIQFSGAIYPSLALASLSAFRENSMVALVAHPQSEFLLRVGGQDIALDQGADLLLRFRKAAFVRHSAATILNDNQGAPDLTGKLVVVGTSARGLGVLLATPAKRSVPGIEIQATAVDNLLKRDFFRRPWWAASFQLAIAVLFAIAAVSLLFRNSAWVAPLGLAIMAALAWTASLCLLEFSSLYVSPLVPTIVLTAGGALFGLQNVFSHRQQMKRTSRDAANANQFISSALEAVTAVRDIETGQHLTRIQRYVRSLCEELARRGDYRRFLSSEMIELFVQVAPIHDVGKVGIRDEILRKPGPLSSDEFQHMKGHVTMGKEILEKARRQSGLRDELFFQTASEMVYSHHERWDGLGYPLGLKGSAIPLAGRILAVADVYDALVSKRPYKDPLAHSAAVLQIVGGRGSQFDPDVVDAFRNVESLWPALSEDCKDDNGAAAVATR